MLTLDLIKLEGDQLLLSAQGGMKLENIAQFRNAVEILCGKYDELFLDMGEVTDMDSAAAEMLVLMRAKALVAGSTIKLIKLSEKISLLLFVKLVTAFGPPPEAVVPFLGDLREKQVRISMRVR
jgi:anti-anti-sigma regulatory factor